MTTNKNRQKYYAVRKGRKPGIYRDWPTCQEQVIRYPNAEYKSFSSESEANQYLNTNKEKQKSKVSEVIAYVDGSFKRPSGKSRLLVAEMKARKSYYEQHLYLL